MNKPTAGPATPPQPVCADRDARTLALDPERSFIVQAPAGSGKTELLVRRYLRLLAVVDAPEEIIAITFTRKAAAEMRNRILQALQAATAPTADTPDANEQARLALARRAAARSEQLGWQLERNPGRMEIRTIDSFCARLTHHMPLLARMGGQPATVEDATELYREAAANTLRRLQEDAAGPGGDDDARKAAVRLLLAQLDNNRPRLRDMLVSMLRKRDQWLRHLVGQEPDRQALEGALAQLITRALQEVDQALRALPLEDVEQLAGGAQYAASNRQQPWPADKALPPPVPNELESWQFLARLCLTQAGDWRRSLDVRAGFPPGLGGQQAKQDFVALLNRLREQPALLPLIQALRELPPQHYDEQDWRVLEALCRLLPLASAELLLLFAERNQVDFTEVSLAALRALGTEDSPADLALYLDYQIRHVLVDEYQDVSVNQYALLERLTAGWSAQDGHSLFLVGDPMQSIYRFRDAEVGMFLRTWEQQRLGQTPVQRLSLKTNFRSDPALVEWVNQAFAQMLPARSDPLRGAVGFSPATAARPPALGSGVFIHPLIARNDAQEAQLALAQIRQIRAVADAGDIAILVRARAQLHALCAALAGAGLAFRAVEIERLQTRPTIQDLLALTRALLHPADRVAWLAVLRAPWCGLSLADLLALVGEARDATVWQLLQDPARCQALSETGQRRARCLCGVLEQALAQQARLPLRRWVEGVWLRLGGPATLDAPDDLHNAACFFELLDELDTGGQLPDRAALRQGIESLYAGVDYEADDSLQIMTIHKAKGLEFDHVILPCLSRTSRSDDTQLLLWSEQARVEGGAAHTGLLLAPVKSADVAHAPIYDFIRRSEQQKQRHEEGRLLYVAATRARRQLHLIGDVRAGADGLVPPPGNTLLARLWPVVAESFQRQFERQSDASIQAPPPEAPAGMFLRRLKEDWTRPEAPPSVNWHSPNLGEDNDNSGKNLEFQWAGRTIMHVGTVVHRYLLLMTTEGLAQWDDVRIAAERPAYRAELRALATPDAELEQACEQVGQALEQQLTDPRGRWILAGHSEQASEYALSGLYQGKVVNVIIDRTFVDEQGIRWIIDYKTSRHESTDIKQFLDQQQERYREQLEKYAAIMSALDDRPIRLGLYFPLLRGWREWAFS